MSKNDILKEIRDRFKQAIDYWDPIFTRCIDDLKFTRNQDNEQWPSDIKSQREQDGRPCLTINKIASFADAVIGDIRQNEPSIKVKPVDSKADPETAEIISGLIKNIENQNNAEICYDTAAESAAICGFGAFRIGTDYAEDDSFDLDITMSRIKNPFTVYYDPQAQSWDRDDARYCFITERIPKEVFEETYPKKVAMPAEGKFDGCQYWGDDKTIRIVEYFKRVETVKTIILVKAPTGELFTTQDKPKQEELQMLLSMGWQIVKEKQAPSHKIVWYKASAGDILEGPTDWPGKYIPIPLVLGKELCIEGETDYRGIVRHAKDPQRLYNYNRSTSAEIIALAPKAPFLVTSKMIGAYQDKWNNAHKKSYPYLPYDADPQAPGVMPKRADPIAVNTGVQTEVIVADQEIHDTTGMQQANMGQKSNEKSGKAILARQREGDIANFPYFDNLGRAMKYAGKIILDLIPKVYDTARIIRVMNPDASDKLVAINQPMQGPDGKQKLYDLTVGKYDVVVTIGPSFTTQRDEAAASMMEFLAAVPAAGPLIGDLVAKNLDWPGAQVIEKRLKALLPPALLAMEGDGNRPMPPPPPDPMMQQAQMLQMKQMESETQKKALEAEKMFHEVRKAEQETRKTAKEADEVGKDRAAGNSNKKA